MAARTNEIQNEGSSERWFGRFTHGKWYCDCNGRARCLTVTNGGPNNGKRFWTCLRDRHDPERCPFFVYLEDEEKAKAWHRRHNPQTPTRNHLGDRNAHTPPTDRTLTASGLGDNPFSKAKRKRSLSREISDETENPDSSNKNGVHNSYSQNGEASSRGFTKVARFATLGQTFNERLNASEASMPTPKTDDNIRRAASWAREESPTPRQPRKVLREGGDSTPELTKTVLNLIRTDGVALKESTKIKIRHEIEMELDASLAMVQRYKQTISRFTKKLDELEATVGHLTAGGALDDIIELSD